jgi:Lysyl oxidase
MSSRIAVAALVVAALLATVGPAAAAPDNGAGGGLLPDLRTVVPQHLQLVNAGQKEILRFSNGIANTGPGPWALRPEPSIEFAKANNLSTVSAVQEIRDANTLYKCGEQPKQVTACYNVVSESVAGVFAFHPEHNHWHIGDVALFEVRKGSPTGPIVGGNSIKTTFCLIDWYKLVGNASSSQRVFFDCYTSFQGIQSGWVDQYHQSTEGQQLDLTGVPNANDYYLVSTANYAGRFKESDSTNNTAWVKFRLSSDSNGNRKIEVTAHSPCVMGTGLCGENAPNR